MSSEPSVPQIVEPSTVASDAAMVRALAAERDYVNGLFAQIETRLDAMDRATEVLHETVTRTPTDIQQAVGHLRELTDEKFGSIQTQFKERDIRSERESRDNKIAVDAAFASAKEIAANERESTTLAIAKSERATEKNADTQGELISDLKTRVERLESEKRGGRDTTASIYAFAGFLLTVLIIGGIVAAALALK